MFFFERFNLQLLYLKEEATSVGFCESKIAWMRNFDNFINFQKKTAKRSILTDVVCMYHSYWLYTLQLCITGNFQLVVKKGITHRSDRFSRFLLHSVYAGTFSRFFFLFLSSQPLARRHLNIMLWASLMKMLKICVLHISNPPHPLQRGD